MEKNIFKNLKGRKVILSLKPRDLALTGTIDAVFDDCIQFRTEQMTSYLSFEKITSVRELKE